VGVVVAGGIVPAWIAGLLDDLTASGTVELTGVSLTPNRPYSPRTPATLSRRQRILARGDERLFHGRAKLLAPVDLRAWAREREVRVAESRGAYPAESAPEGRDALTDTVDIVLDLSGGDGSSAPCAQARLAVWWPEGAPVRVGGVHADLPEVVASVLCGSPVVDFTLYARLPGRSETVALDRAICPTHPSSPLLTGVYLAACARQLIVERLTNASPEPLRRDVFQGVENRLRTEPDAGAAKLAPATPGTPELHQAVASPSIVTAGIFFARVAGRQVHKAVFEQRWNLLLGEQSSELLLPDPALLHPLLPPPGRFWADPFPVEHDGHIHIFFEEFLYEERRGRIAIITLDEDGRPGQARVALERDSHLSYPYAFKREGRLYMIPENAESGGLDLYECVELPDKWVRRRRLLEGVRIVDASLVEWQGLWWMFASLKAPAGLPTAVVLVLYCSEDPVNGAWQKHPLSPLLADVTNARPAGAPFVFGERLYRLAQDGSKGYGRAIAVNEVLSLTPTHFAERRVALVQPHWARALCGTHTLNRVGRTVVMDECRYVRRRRLRPRADSMPD
jgi:hypothetical protein